MLTASATVLILTGGSTVAQAAVWTDQTDYSPGSAVTFNGDNSDGAGYQAGETVHVAVNDPSGSTQSCDATADDSGVWSCQITLGPGVASVGGYDYTATGQTSGVSQSGTFTDSACPNAVGGRPTDPNVTASFTTSGNTATYSITTPNESPSGGIPGLIEYCVYPDGGSLPTAETASYDSWSAGTESAKGLLDFARPGGDPTNLPFDGSTQQLGTATWSGTAPASQTILLHINDPNECAALGLGSATCFVLPGTGTGPTPKDLQVTKTATPSFTRTYTWNITKSVDKTEIDTPGSATFNYTVQVTHDSGTDGNWQVNGTITVANPNPVDFNGVTVTDSTGGGNCQVTDNSTGSNETVPAKGSLNLPYTCTYSSNPGAVTDTATAAWDANTYNTPDNSASGTAPADFGTTTPTIVDGTVTVTDPLGGGTLGTAGYTQTNPITFTYSPTFTGDPAGTCTTHDNTATFTTDTTKTTGSDSKKVTVCVGADLTVAKDANPSFTRTYAWGIHKSVDKTLIEQTGGGTASASYAVKVDETGFTDSGWQVSGSITVTNPNDWEAVTANVADAIDNNGSCTVTGGTNVSVPASKSVPLPYTCTYSSAPSPSSGTNTATAMWDKAAAFTPAESADGTAAYAFGAPTSLVNKTITVKDTFNNGTPTTLGTLTATDTQPLTSQTYNYTHTLNVPSFNCVTYPNTASIVETGQTASKTVEVCGPAKTGALTMGYWQNKNGQGIITGGATTAGVCNSGTWLRQYAPFQDLSATATCAQVASYVTNIIKTANASGAAMNAMLKAQTLATALDVYFSGPSLGGNKINAPAPIGGVTIDLTKICHMIDSSSGTGTCSGTYENVSSAFGGANSLTISQMLGYAASQSNLGGTMWYGQVKATQGLAKDAFDAINNQVVFSP